MVERDRKRATKKYRINPSIANYRLIQTHNRKCRKTLQKVKREGWKNFCSSLNSLTPNKEIWNMIRRYRNRKLSATGANCKGMDPLELTEKAIKNICPPSCSPPNIIIPDSSDSSLNELAWMDSPFSISEFTMVLDSARAGSSPGLDRIDFKLLRAPSLPLRELLLRILNNLFVEGSFPEAWLHSLVHLIPKSQSKGVRPIALTSCVLKTLDSRV